MPTKAARKIVHIDQDKCNGCGLCIPNCHEGAIRIIDGKARLVAENLCDGLGACLGKCPVDAITVEERQADEFDETAVKRHLTLEAHDPTAAQGANTHASGGGCPGSRMRMLHPQRAPGVAGEAQGGAAHQRPSQLVQWPVQLALVPVSGPMWDNADVLICADCVPFACAGFHEELLAGKALAIACPKIDDMEPYVRKLAEIFAGNSIKSITVAHMEVPCCGGIVRAVHEARAQAGRTDLNVRDITIGIDGQIQGHT